MKKRKVISLILILLILFIFINLLYTNAKYTSTANGRATASVAKYVFNVTGSDSFGGTDIKALTLAETVDEKTLVNGKIAPGTSGSLDIVVDTTGAEVAINYEVTFLNNNEHALPKNLLFKLDGKKWSFDEKIKGTIYANAENQTVTRRIEWSWAYETADDTGDITNGDIDDTTDGINAFDHSFSVIATGVQAKPTGVASTAQIVGSIATENVKGIHKAQVTLYKTGETPIKTIETNADGSYEIDIDEAGTYNIEITKLGYLSYRVINIKVESGSIIELEKYDLIAGDVAVSGEIEIDDLVDMNEKVGEELTEQDAIYDLNEDGVIDMTDRDILKKNYGMLAETVIWIDKRN